MVEFIKKNPLTIVAIMIFLAAAYAFIFFLLPLDVFLWDESHHAFYATLIYDDIRAFDLASFWAHTNSQALWMPLHSWWSALFLIIFGHTYIAARLSSLVLFMISAYLVYLISIWTSKEKGWLVGIGAVAMFLTSPQLLSLATLNMQEFMGIILCLYLVYFIISTDGRAGIKEYLTIGAILSVSYWAKTNYAIMSILGVGLYQLSKVFEMKGGQWKRASFGWLKDNLMIIAGSLPLLILWWATPPFQRKYVLGFAFRQGAVAAPGNSMLASVIGSAAFYFQSIITSYTFSFWLGLGCVASLFISFFFYRNRGLRLVSLMFLANLIFISAMSFVQERYISTAVPLLFILLSYFIVLLADVVIQHKKYVIGAYAICMLLGLLIAGDLLSLTGYTRQDANRAIMYLMYKENLSQFKPPFMFGATKRPQWSIPLLDKKYPDFTSRTGSRLADVLDYFSLNIEKGRSIATMVSTAQISPYVFYWHFHGRSPIFTINDLGAGNNNFWFADYFINIEISEQSPYYIDEIEKKWKEIEPKLLRSGMIRLASRKDFPDIGITAKIFKREGFARF